MDKFNIDIFTSKLAIGSLWIVSTFLFSCGFYNLYPFIETLSSSKTWGAIVTIPILIFSYTIGGIVIYISDAYLFPIYKIEKETEIISYIKLTNTKNEFLIRRYEAIKYQREFFSATIPTCIFLGIAVIWGSIGVLFWNRRLEYVCIGLGLITILASYPLYLISKNLRNEIVELLKRIES